MNRQRIYTKNTFTIEYYTDWVELMASQLASEGAPSDDKYRYYMIIYLHDALDSVIISKSKSKIHPFNL